MGDKETTGFVFRDVKNSKIEGNSASGYQTGFDVTGADNIDFSYNTADIKSRNLIDGFLSLKKELQELQTDFPDKEEAREAIDEVIEQINKEKPRPGILKMLYQRLDTIVVGAMANVLSDEHGEILKRLGDGVESLKNFIESI